ncbi:MAG: hypothetical protein JWN53_351 [Gemmatimonadetes bacterium]|nr:hypothetical protein [Gemmatimonadota bacterium]
MRDDLLQYYERELTYLRRMGADFAQKYPKVAGRLLLEPTKCEDPHVERMLEAFAFLAARVHLKIDDDFPQVTEALLDVVYPHYVRPIPSMTIVEMRLDPEQGKLTTGYKVPRNTYLYSRPVDGVPCRFRTAYDTTIWPVTVAAASWTTPDRLQPPMRFVDATAVLRLQLRCLPDVSFSMLDLTSLRLHLNGESAFTAALYELFDRGKSAIVVRETGTANPKAITLPPGSLQPAGFGADEGMLPYPGRSFQAYRLLQEYFAFPAKYLFFDLRGFDAVRAAGMGPSIEVLIPISPFERAEWRPMLEAGVDASTFRLGCAPAINLFEQVSEPVLLTQRRHEYPLVADVRRRLTTQIFSVDRVSAVVPDSARPLQLRPFYAPREPAGARPLDPSGTDDAPDLFWMARRRESGWRADQGADTYLSLIDHTGRLTHPEYDALTARLTCFNGELPSRLPFGNERGDFELEGGGPVREIVALLKPTRVVQPPLGDALGWRLISQLSLNYLSLVDSGVDSLRDILRLHDFGDTASTRRQIAGVAAVRSAPAFARIATEHGLTFARGRRVELDLDEEEFTGGGVYLFASVLERFLGLYVSLNSFSVLSARTRQRKTAVREWPPRAGWKPLL